VELPKASYLVCASQRSGTELLCRGLAATGVAGCPREYFLAEDPARLPDWGFWEEGPFAAGHDVTGKESYLALVYRSLRGRPPRARRATTTSSSPSWRPYSPRARPAGASCTTSSG
jgi:hypothetical protein